MKQIESIKIWKNGEEKTANILNAIIIKDDLISSCTFYYQLCEGGQVTDETPLFQGAVLAEGNLIMSDEKYIEWNGSNNYAFLYIAEKLNLKIIDL